MRVIDEQIMPVDYNTECDLVTLTVNTSVSKRAYEIADNFRKRGAKVVFGGLHVAFMPKESLKYSNASVIEDSEDSWPALLSDFRKQKLKEIIHKQSIQTLKY